MRQVAETPAVSDFGNTPGNQVAGLQIALRAFEPLVPDPFHERQLFVGKQVVQVSQRQVHAAGDSAWIQVGIMKVLPCEPEYSLLVKQM